MSKLHPHLWKVRFNLMIRVLVFANNIDDAKEEARRLRPDCKHKRIVEVSRIDNRL